MAIKEFAKHISIDVPVRLDKLRHIAISNAFIIDSVEKETKGK